MAMAVAVAGTGVEQLRAAGRPLQIGGAPFLIALERAAVVLVRGKEQAPKQRLTKAWTGAWIQVSQVISWPPKPGEQKQGAWDETCQERRRWLSAWRVGRDCEPAP
jgi:hypothetical protein